MIHQFFIRVETVTLNPLKPQPSIPCPGEKGSGAAVPPTAGGSKPPAREESLLKQAVQPSSEGLLPLARPFEGRAARTGVVRSSGDAHRLLRVLLFLVLALSAPALARAQDVITDDEVNAIAQKLYCPVCENITLDTCGTAACDDWRYEIRLQLEQGKTEDQIVEDFVRRFGDRVVGTPVDPALRALSLYTPWLLVAAALIASGVVLAKRRSAASAVPLTATGASSRYAEQFEQDLSS